MNFLIDALETGDLDYFQIRKIENKELMTLSKKKAGNITKLNPDEKRNLKNLDGGGKPLDKNLQLLKDMLELVEVELKEEGDEEENEKEDDSDQELRSISFKNSAVAPPPAASKATLSITSKDNLHKRFKQFEHPPEEQKNEMSEEEDVNFHEIPTGENPKSFDLNDKRTRLELYERMYLKRRQMRKRGKWNPKLSNYTELIFSYPINNNTASEMERNVSQVKNDMALDNVNRNPSSMSFF